MGPRHIRAWRFCLMAQLRAYSKTVQRTHTKGFPSRVCRLHGWKENDYRTGALEQFLNARRIFAFEVSQ
jgi:hypothetical protein